MATEKLEIFIADPDMAGFADAVQFDSQQPAGAFAGCNISMANYQGAEADIRAGKFVDVLITTHSPHMTDLRPNFNDGLPLISLLREQETARAQGDGPHKRTAIVLMTTMTPEPETCATLERHDAVWMVPFEMNILGELRAVVNQALALVAIPELRVNGAPSPAEHRNFLDLIS